MARRRVSPTDSMFTGARWKQFYPDAYSRTSNPWQTRVGRRNREFASFANLLGLNTAFDDLHKGDGESPYLRNVRYMGDKQSAQRAQVTSRNGAKLLGTIGVFGTDPAPIETHIEMWEGRAIEFTIEPTEELIVGLSLEIRNRELAKGRLRVFLTDVKGNRPYCDANINLEGISQNEFVHRSVRFIEPISGKNGAVIRLEIEGDVEPGECGDISQGRKIWIAANGSRGHLAANYIQPNVNECMREQNYDWQDEASIPCYGVRYVHEGTPMKRGTMVKTNTGTYLVFPIRYTTGIELWRFNIATHNLTKLDTGNLPIDGRAKAVRFAQGLGKLYFVDGYSPLKRIDLSNWTVELAIAKQEDIDEEGVTPEDMQAQPGASLILRINNRIFLSGFAEDPNFVQYSILNSLTGTPDEPTENAGVQYDQYSDISWFYSPDRSPKDSGGPITALANFDGNLAVFRTNGASVWTLGDEFEAPSQSDMYAYNIGVEEQEDVCNFNGTLFIYNRSEGVRRFSGSGSSFTSMAIDNELRKLPKDSPRFMFGHANKLRLYCDLKNRGYADHNFLYHTTLNSWYCDDNTPVCWVVGDQTSDRIFAMHPSYPAIYEVDADDQYTDFHSSINMEYHTQYKSPGELSGWTILHRVLVKLVASSTNIWHIGVDFDHEDNPAVWRKYVRQQTDSHHPPESVFSNTEPAGTQTLDMMMRVKCRDFQVRVAVSCWKDHAMLQYIEGQYGGKAAL